MSDEQFLAMIRIRVKDARLKLGFTQEEVAERVDLTVRQYQRYEGQKVKGSMSLLTLRKISLVLGVELVDLVREEG